LGGISGRQDIFSEYPIHVERENRQEKDICLGFKDIDGYVSEVQSDTIYRFNAYYAVLVAFFLQAAMVP
jgi:hypothetical protein